jgi:hypothetical protein
VDDAESSTADTFAPTADSEASTAGTFVPAAGTCFVLQPPAEPP